MKVFPLELSPKELFPPDHSPKKEVSPRELPNESSAQQVLPTESSPLGPSSPPNKAAQQAAQQKKSRKQVIIEKIEQILKNSRTLKRVIEVIVAYVKSVDFLKTYCSLNYLYYTGYFLPFVVLILVELIDRFFYWKWPDMLSFLKLKPFLKLKYFAFYKFLMSFYDCEVNFDTNSSIGWPRS